MWWTDKAAIIGPIHGDDYVYTGILRVCFLHSLYADKSKCDKILDGYTVRSRTEGRHDQLDCTPRHFDSQYVILAFRTRGRTITVELT